MSQFCTPTYHPSSGDEDIARHSSRAGLSFYTVGVGFVPGIYTREHAARAQVDGFSNGRWKKAASYEGAVAEWNRQCELYHDHANELGSDLSSLSESPPSSLLSMLSLSPTAPPTPVLPNPSAHRKQPLALSPSLRMPTPHSAPSTPSRGSRITPASANAPAPSRPSPVVSTRSSLSMSSIEVVPSTRIPGQWREGDTLWGIEGSMMLFEDRYDTITVLQWSSANEA
ncbi:hypothetical protein R3P38DRAFT_3221660 [Favolaschia claudopus]|uniref:Ribonuclease H1 N-terminal domain-containing protein n=1 Tax=Favolaschia claudopus TaxID=2862362 RepID=A0AAV9ZZY4_9AGAR